MSLVVESSPAARMRREDDYRRSPSSASVFCPPDTRDKRSATSRSRRANMRVGAETGVTSGEAVRWFISSCTGTSRCATSRRLSGTKKPVH